MNCSRSASASDVAHRLGAIGKQPHHLRRRLQIALGIGRQQPPGRIERRVLANGREHVEERPLLGRGKAHAAGRDERHAKRLGQADQRVVVVFLIAPQMALQLDVDVAAAEQPDQPIEQPADAVALGQQQRPAGQRDQAGREPLEVLRASARPRLSARAASCASRDDRGCASPRGIRPGRARPIGRVGDWVIG